MRSRSCRSLLEEGSNDSENEVQEQAEEVVQCSGCSSGTLEPNDAFCAECGTNRFAGEGAGGSGDASFKLTFCSQTGSEMNKDSSAVEVAPQRRQSQPERGGSGREEGLWRALQPQEQEGLEVNEGVFDIGCGSGSDESSGPEPDISPRGSDAMPGRIMHSLLFNDLDLDSGGSISREEWVAGFNRVAPPSRGGAPNSGVISRKEWALLGAPNSVFDAIAGDKQFATIGVRDWTKAFLRLDLDKSGSISREEWFAFAAGRRNSKHLGPKREKLRLAPTRRDCSPSARKPVTGTFGSPDATSAAYHRSTRQAPVTGIEAVWEASWTQGVGGAPPPDWRSKRVDLEKAQAQMVSSEKILLQQKFALAELESESGRREVAFNQEVVRLEQEADDWEAQAQEIRMAAAGEEAEFDVEIAAVQLQLEALRSRKQVLEQEAARMQFGGISVWQKQALTPRCSGSSRRRGSENVFERIQLER